MTQPDTSGHEAPVMLVEKRTYVAPAVKVWGDIEDLTQGSAGATYDTPVLNSKPV